MSQALIRFEKMSVLSGKDQRFLELLEIHLNISDRVEDKLHIATNWLNRYGIEKCTIFIGKERREFVNGKFIES